MPSRTDGFGLTGLEALSAGLPVLVSKNSGFGEALGSVPCGSLFVIGHEDPSAWAAAIKYIWNKGRKSRLDEVKTVRDFFAERYSWSEQCKHLMEKMVELVDGPSCYLEITAQAVEARKQKLNEDLADYSPRVPLETKTGRIENNESEQAAARASCPSHVIEGIRQVYQKCEGVIVPIPWCDEFSFQIENIFTRLKIVAKEKTRGIATTKEVTNMTGIFTPHKCCEQPLIVLIEGEPGMGKTTYCQKLVFDWASKQCREWDETFPRIDVLLFLRCHGIKSSIWDAIEDQILPDDIKPEEKEMFFQFLKENPSKVLFMLDGVDEADPKKLEMYLKLIQKKQLPGCYIVLTSRHDAGRKVRPYTDTLLEIVGFTRADAKCFIRKYFQHAEHLAEKLISKVYTPLYAHNYGYAFEDEYKYTPPYGAEDENLRELLKNPLNTLLLCVIFEDLEGNLPTNRTQLYVEIVLFILRRYERKNGLSSRVIDNVTNLHSVLTDDRNIDELFHVLKFMSGIIAQRSEETAVSIVEKNAKLVQEPFTQK
ncbi:PREDICTED: uncharacterized protein LOC107357334 [Acropora digitifera]|uniref:uncharacterized protein LOC107357334 n=1 Tax=Acropora digitifera TaxID=70779 RepID=UPI00077A5DEB|nr:PREDICTED: uncharacterized protein LOC107357334 [Acropora digitifera]